jgi:precorrin-6B methylase 2
MSCKILASNLSIRTARDIVRFFPQWWQYLKPQRNSVSDKYPWLTFGAIKFIEKIVRSDMQVFEYGSGGSTLFWSERVNKVVSIEHNKEWYEKMVNEFRKLKIDNVEYQLAEAEVDDQFSTKRIDDPKHYISDDNLFVGKNFESYVKKIDRFPDAYFDIVVVDGRARPSCILHSQKKIKSGGYLIIDNSERQYYTQSFAFSKSYWKIRKFYGPVPYIGHFSETTILKKK